MSNTNQIDETKLTEFNSNQLIIYRLHKINERIQELLFLKMYPETLGSLYDFFAEIEPKLEEFKKVDYLTPIKSSFHKAERMIVYSNAPQFLINQTLLETRSLLYKGANAVGMGMTNKDSGRGAVQFG